MEGTQGTQLQFNLDQEFQDAAKEVQQTGEAYQRALGRLQYLQTIAQRLNPPTEELANELQN